MKESYAALGSIFEYLNRDCDYVKWSQYLINTLDGLDAGRTGVDIGCGNGYFTRALVKNGKSVIGTDISVHMLTKAEELAAAEGVRAQFVLGDVTKLKLLKKVDFAVAINDCINYVEPEKIRAAFCRVAGCLKKGGAFVFDVSTEYKLKEIIGDNLFAEDGEDVTLLWFNSFSDGRLVMDITVFTAAGGGLFKREDERQVQYAHGRAALENALKASGFDILRVEGHLGAAVDEKTERLNFICVKR